MFYNVKMEQKIITIFDKINLLLEKDLQYYFLKNQRKVSSFKLIDKNSQNILYSYKNPANIPLDIEKYKNHFMHFIQQNDFSDNKNVFHLKFQFFSKTSIKNFISLIYSENLELHQRLLLISSIYHSSFFSSNKNVHYFKLWSFLFQNTKKDFHQFLFNDFLHLFSKEYCSISSLHKEPYNVLLSFFQFFKKNDSSLQSNFNNNLLIDIDLLNFPLFSNFFDILKESKKNYLKHNSISNIVNYENFFHNFIQNLFPQKDWIHFNLNHISVQKKSDNIFQNSTTLFYPFEINFVASNYQFPKFQFQTKFIFDTIFKHFESQKIFHYFHIDKFIKSNNEKEENIFLLEFQPNKPILLEDFQKFFLYFLTDIHNVYDKNISDTLIDSIINSSLRNFLIEKTKENIEEKLLQKSLQLKINKI